MSYPKFCQSFEKYQLYIQDELKRQQLPDAAPEAVKTSYTLAQEICERIKINGKIPFSSFMQMALYQSGLGYYAAGNQKFGAGGDFVTAPEISPLFAQCFARQFAQVFENVEQNLLEIGAGSGVFAVETLLALEELNLLPSQYFILEVSAELRQRQKQTITSKASNLIDRVEWLDELPKDFEGIVFANEVIDAIPVDCYKKSQKNLEQGFVKANDEGFFFDWCSQSLEDKKSVPAIEQDVYFEHRPLAASWVKSILDSCNKAVVFLVDYGYSESELLHPSRAQGTLQHYYRHHKTANPLALVGMQDLTSSVDFTQLAMVVDEQESQLIGYTTQSMFLIASGIEQLAQQKMESLDASDTMSPMKLGQQLKQLLMPDEMGETCKVLAFSKDAKLELSGFSLDNRLHKL